MKPDVVQVNDLDALKRSTQIRALLEAAEREHAEMLAALKVLRRAINGGGFFDPDNAIKMIDDAISKVGGGAS